MALEIQPTTWRNTAEHLRKLATAINQMADGRVNCFGSVTLTASAASTVVSDLRVGTDSVITFMPTTANAAAEIGNGTMYVGTVTAESFTITHANNAQNNRTFRYHIAG